jgi:hypothetical protein
MLSKRLGQEISGWAAHLCDGAHTTANKREETAARAIEASERTFKADRAFSDCSEAGSATILHAEIREDHQHPAATCSSRLLC